MKKLSLDNVILLHEMIVKETGGKLGIRDYSLLDSSINAPFLLLMVNFYILQLKVNQQDLHMG